MARLSINTERAADIARVVREAGVDEVQAAFFVALARGEVDGDVVPDRPVSSEERR